MIQLALGALMGATGKTVYDRRRARALAATDVAVFAAHRHKAALANGGFEATLNLPVQDHLLAFMRVKLEDIAADSVPDAETGLMSLVMPLADGQDATFSVTRSADKIVAPYNVFNGTALLAKSFTPAAGAVYSFYLPYATSQIRMTANRIRLPADAATTGTTAVPTAVVDRLYVIPGTFDKEEIEVIRARIAAGIDVADGVTIAKTT